MLSQYSAFTGRFCGLIGFLGPKEGRGPYESDASKPDQKLTHLVDLLGHLLSRNYVSKFSDLGPPPPPLTDKGGGSGL